MRRRSDVLDWLFIANLALIYLSLRQINGWIDQITRILTMMETLIQ